MDHSRNHARRFCCTMVLAAFGFFSCAAIFAADRFDGRFYSGEGDLEYLQLLETAQRMFTPDPELQNIAMFYMPAWNGLVEGPTWDAWWIQNSYGTTYCALPFYHEPLATFLQNSQDLWFDQMGDGKTRRPFDKYDLTPPDGCLCDAARPGWFVAKQGDGRVDIHDWAIEFTAAGVVMQAEALLISRDLKAIEHYLPKLRRCAALVESRRDPKNNLFLAGPAGNLLAPSFAGWRKSDGTFGQAYLTGLSITYIAALDRLIELEKLGGKAENVQRYAEQRESARKGLSQLTTEEGYFIKSLDPDGVKHGVYGAEKHGYFEASPNHDAICFRVVDDAQAAKIYGKIASIPGLRPHDLVIANAPGLDDMYTPPTDWLWKFGTWVNGGHWSTCEGRMMMAYYRLGKFDDARRSMQKMLTYARQFRMDNPLVDFGNAVYQPKQAVNCCYDNWAVPAALRRGLFEYLYRADGLTVLPHIPNGITRLEQQLPVRFGDKQLYLATAGQGSVTSVLVNGQPLKTFDSQSVFLPYDKTPNEAVVQIVLGNAMAEPFVPRKVDPLAIESLPSLADLPKSAEADSLAALLPKATAIRQFHDRLVAAGLGHSYEAAHARLAVACFATACTRLKMVAEGKVPPLPADSQAAADKAYVETASRLCGGLETAVLSYASTEDAKKRQVYQSWTGEK